MIYWKHSVLGVSCQFHLFGNSKMTSSLWSLAAIETKSGDRAAALLPSGLIVSVDVIPPELSPLDVLRRWEEFAPRLRSWGPAAGRAVPGAKLKAPIRYPAKLICVGANYRDHRGEMHDGGEHKQPGKPFLFLKPPTTTIIGPGDNIFIRGREDRVDWEGEIALVIGKQGRFIDRSAALEYIAGYMLINDVSARGAFEPPNAWHPAMAYDWIANKAQDTFSPIGPAMLPAWFVPEPDNIPFSLTVNGATEQSDTTRNLIYDIRAIVAAASQLMTLEPGDIIATGTPSGVGAAKGRFLVDGDEVVVSSPMIGSIKNTVRQIASVPTLQIEIAE
jgi:2-keto-4-pentenoate hydratase/2-oxohepta-3-ene-1,7-dioic acid hydratase in catechol pathway